MEEGSISLTAFSAPKSHYEWLVMPIGLKNSPQIFKIRMGNIFKNLDQHCLAYINDILIFTKAMEQHKDDDLVVTQRYIDHGTILGKNKCIYVEQEMEFLV